MKLNGFNQKLKVIILPLLFLTKRKSKQLKGFCKYSDTNGTYATTDYGHPMDWEWIFGCAVKVIFSP